MCSFVETMRADGGRIPLIDYHNRRMEATRRRFFPTAPATDLRDVVSPENTPDATKVRVVYGRRGIEDVSYEPYSPKTVRSLKIVRSDLVDYSYKSTDRSCLHRLMERRGGCDDILIVRRGMITDTSFTNVAFFDGRLWLTPATPLLPGTRRAALLDRRLIVEADIGPEDLSRYSRVCLFNAMNDLGRIVLPVGSIVF